MANIEITCINKPDRNSRHEHITHLGNSTGKWTREAVIGWIESKEHTFYTNVKGETAYIGVVTPAQGSKYLRTYADKEWNDNLLALSECR
ncbi:DUF3892 domain-containing protein [Reyranella sp.]|uniref:DUF3892 domain-containing protein n=1 Tax=Reyranella sp. TaxID=1929291 RepID=UPI00272F43E6|nr:DUF3892 domain-containing protein [Reyranella sp.]MDP2372204.1 DUF3892 domain-containing protein [Reyranella sp.]